MFIIRISFDIISIGEILFTHVFQFIEQCFDFINDGFFISSLEKCLIQMLKVFGITSNLCVIVILITMCFRFSIHVLILMTLLNDRCFLNGEFFNVIDISFIMIFTWGCCSILWFLLYFLIECITNIIDSLSGSFDILLCPVHHIVDCMFGCFEWGFYNFFHTIHETLIFEIDFIFIVFLLFLIRRLLLIIFFVFIVIFFVCGIMLKVIIHIHINGFNLCIRTIIQIIFIIILFFDIIIFVDIFLFCFLINMIIAHITNFVLLLDNFFLIIQQITKINHSDYSFLV